MKYVIYGAGAIGGTIGARLVLSGFETVFIARGAHLEALRSHGLTFQTPDGVEQVPVTAAGHPDEIEWDDADMVFMCMKGQDSEAALGTLAAAAGTEVGVICCQNGVVNERIALRRFPYTYAMVVMLPATHLEPGVVQAQSAPTFGVLDAARYPGSVDERITQTCAALEAAGFSARPDPAVMRQKYTKLLMNLGNSISAAVGPDARGGNLMRLARAEAEACYKAASIDYMTDEEFAARRAGLITVRPVAGSQRGGGSSWQSLVRGTGNIEADYLNGEICQLGRLHGVPTPVNQRLQEIANRMARERAEPGAYTEEQLLALVEG